MAGSGSDSSSFPIGGIATAVFLVASAVFVNQFPYVASRPPTSELTQQEIPDNQDVAARLWQDPFTASTDHRDAIRKGRRDGLDVTRDLRRHTTVAVADQAHALTLDSIVMPVIVPGGPYSEDAEGRRRTRYAVVTAFMRLGLAPRDSEHVAYFTPSPTTRQPALKHRLPEIVPYEWFDRVRPDDSTRVTSVLVLWLDASALSSPLTGLRDLLRDTGICPGDASAARAKIVIVGPSGSGDLVHMMAEASTLGPAHTSGRCLAGARIYSPFATALKGNERASLKGGSDIEFFQMIASDRDLMRPLATELGLRGVDLGQPEQMVAVVAELDTAYGRALSNTVQAGLCEGVRASPNPRGLPCSDRIIPFHYLRGLDGRVPRRDEVKDEDAHAKNDAGPYKPAQPPSRNLERAEDQSQFDYLRRLADRMAAREIEELSGEHRRFTAIGIVGSDVYDKLLVLQALRRNFPGALFFTTDLDARLLHPKEFRWTRNLVVVSSHGLRLRDGAQIPVPPFRNNYQTATHLATTAGLISAVPGPFGPVKDETIKEWIRQPRVFEIGRTEAVDLTPDDRDKSAYDAAGPPCRKSIAACAYVQPWPDRFVQAPPTAFRWGLGAAAVALLFLSLISSRVRQAVARAASWTLSGYHLPLAVAVSLAVGCFAWVAVRAIQKDGTHGEPFRVLEGVSLWPTEIIRFGAGLAAIAFIVHVELTRTHWNRVLTARYFPAMRPIEVPRFRDLFDWTTWRAMFAGKPSVTTLVAQQVADAEAEWRRHLYQSAPIAHAVRVFVGSLLFLSFATCVFYAFGDPPHVPFRGPAALWIDQTILLFAVVGQLVLIFAVGDTIKLCDKYASYLGAPVPNRWSKETRTRFSFPDRDSPFDAWIDVRIMADWTEGLLHLIYFPFVVIFLMIIARTGLFDGWDVPWPLVIIFTATLACASGCVVILRGAAERLRRLALERLTAALITVQGSALDASFGRKLEVLVAEVRELRRGAFAPLSHQPLVSAAMLPLSGAGGVTLVEYFFLR